MTQTSCSVARQAHASSWGVAVGTPWGLDVHDCTISRCWQVSGCFVDQ